MAHRSKHFVFLLPLVVLLGACCQILAQDPPDRLRGWLRYIEAQRLTDEGLESGHEPTIDLAIIALRETIRLDPEAPEPRLDLANLYLFGKSDPELAEREAREAVRLAPERPEGHLILGRIAFAILRRQEETAASSASLDRFETVISAYKKVTELDARETEAWLILQTVYEMSRRFDDQITALEKFLAAPPAGPENFFIRQMINPPLTEDRAWFKLSLLYLLRGRREAALTAARQAYESNPESDSYEENLFEVIGWVSTRGEEAEILRQLFEGAPNPQMALRYAQALVKAGREEEALTILRDPSGFSAKEQSVARASLLARALRRINRRTEALATLRAAIVASGANGAAERTGLRLELAETLEEAGRNEEAIAQYESIFDYLLKHEEEKALFNLTVERLVNLLRRTNRRARLQSVLARTRQAVDEQSTLLDQLSIQTLSEDGRLEEALRVTRAVARRQRDDRTWLFTESSLLARLRRFPESIQLIETLLLGTPESTDEDCEIYLQLASIYQQMGDLDRAFETATRAERLASTSSYLRDRLTSARLLLGSILHRQGRSAESIAILREILRVDPVETTALNNLGYFLTVEGRGLEEARRLIERAVAIDPLNGSYLDSLGWVLYRLGERAQARRMLERALVQSPRSATAHEHLGELLRSLGRKAEARRAWESALEYSDDPLQRDRLRTRLKRD